MTKKDIEVLEELVQHLTGELQEKLQSLIEKYKQERLEKNEYVRKLIAEKRKTNPEYAGNKRKTKDK